MPFSYESSLLLQKKLIHRCLTKKKMKSRFQDRLVFQRWLISRKAIPIISKPLHFISFFILCVHFTSTNQCQCFWASNLASIEWITAKEFFLFIKAIETAYKINKEWLIKRGNTKVLFFAEQLLPRLIRSEIYNF